MFARSLAVGSSLFSVQSSQWLMRSLSQAVPACMAIAILASNQINGDPLTGTCFTGLYDTHTLKLFVLGTSTCLRVLYILLARILSLQYVLM